MTFLKVQKQDYTGNALWLIVGKQLYGRQSWTQMQKLNGGNWTKNGSFNAEDFLKTENKNKARQELGT